MHTHPRKWPTIILLAGCLACGLWTALRAQGMGRAAVTLEQTELAVARPGATAQDWLAYGRCLASAGRHAHAAAAFHKTLELDPACKEARVACAIALAGAGQADDLRQFLAQTVAYDPALALEALKHEACHRCLGEAEAARLIDDAHLQQMD